MDINSNTNTDIKEQLRKIFMIKSGRLNSFYKNYLPVYKQTILELTSNCDSDDFKERLYWIFNDITEYPKCKICGESVKTFSRNELINSNSKYSSYCSQTCLCNDPIMKEKFKHKHKIISHMNNINTIEELNIFLYDNYFITDKRKRTQKRNGNIVRSLTNDIKSLIDKHVDVTLLHNSYSEKLYWLLEKYNTEKFIEIAFNEREEALYRICNANDLKSYILMYCINKNNYLNKHIKIMLDDNSLQILENSISKNLYSNNIVEKIYWFLNDLDQYPKRCLRCGAIITCFKDMKDNYPNAFCTKNCSDHDVHRLDKMKATSMKNYGVEHPMQDKKVFEKQLRASHSWKLYTMPSGNIINIQGYEWKALDELLLTYTEDEIIASRKLIPSFWYYTEDRKKHRYYPDIYIPKDNLIIEVKSEWTYNKELYINLLKEQSVKDSGYNYRFMIYTQKMENIL